MSSSTFCDEKIDTSESVEIIPARSPKVLKPRDVSESLGCSLVTARKLMKSGAIPSVSIATTLGRRHLRCSEVALAQYLSSNTTRP